MLMSTILNDNNIAMKFKATIRILFVFGRIIVSIIRIQPNSKDPLFGTALILTYPASIWRPRGDDSVGILPRSLMLES